MRKLSLFVSVLLVAGGWEAALAAPPPECGSSLNGAAIDCGGESLAVIPANTSGARGGSGANTASAGPAKKYVPYTRLTTGPDGKPCLATGYVEQGSAYPDGAISTDPNPERNFPLNVNYPPCPQQTRAPGQAVVETPAMVAARYWEQVPLPKPQPAIKPGWAITGKLAYLETKGQLTHTYTNNTAFGPLEIVAKGSYSVDWGDGETSGPHDFEGLPWPDGRITHDYINVGTYDVVVTERWTATWRLGGQSGTLRALQTTGRIDGFRVEQIQAVIRR